MKRIMLVAIGVVCIAALAVMAYDLTPDDYVKVDLDQAVPVIVAERTITRGVAITSHDLPLLAFFFSSTRMLAWQAALANTSISTWTQVKGLMYHTFDRSTNSAGFTTWTPRPDRKLVGSRELSILALFFYLQQ